MLRETPARRSEVSDAPWFVATIAAGAGRCEALSAMAPPADFKEYWQRTLDTLKDYPARPESDVLPLRNTPGS